MKKISLANNDTAIGVFYAVAAFFIWGLYPLYWKFLDRIPADQILAHRVFWSFIFIFTILIYSRRLSAIKKVILNRENILPILLCAILISINWGIYIWAVNANHIVDASMGQYIEPLLTVFLAMIVLKEKLDFWQKISLTLASTGVIIIALQYGKIPWIALTISLSFSLYALFKKLVNVESIIGLALETAIITPAALVYIVFKQVNGIGALGKLPISTTLILFCSGVVTSLPLLWFTKAAKRIPLSAVGFVHYITPTITLSLGVLVFKEQFTKMYFLSFGFIWTGLILYSLSQMGILKSISPKYLERVKEK